MFTGEPSNSVPDRLKAQDLRHPQGVPPEVQPVEVRQVDLAGRPVDVRAGDQHAVGHRYRGVDERGVRLGVGPDEQHGIVLRVKQGSAFQAAIFGDFAA